MLKLLLRLLGLRRKPLVAIPRTAPPPRSDAAVRKAAAPAARADPADASPAQAAADPELLELLDAKGHLRHTLSGREEKVLSDVARRVEEGGLVLPHLPATSLAAIDMASRPSANIADIVDLIGTDPVLSSELLKISNSALYAGREECETLREAVVRMGLRALRAMILSISMRTVLMRDKNLAAVAGEVWRQAHSVGLIARAVAKEIGMDHERAYVIGLLHDIGKVALLETLRREVPDASELSPALIGRVFYFHHERAGAIIARAWKLPDEIVAVAGCHHHFERNEGHSRSAALARLAHELDLHLAGVGESKAEDLLRARELDFLDVDADDRPQVLAAVREALGGPLAQAA